MGNDILQGHQNQRASILATQFLIDLLKIVELHPSDMPFVCLLHDSTTARQDLTGQWHALAHVRAAALLRHFAVYCEHRFRVDVETRLMQGMILRMPLLVKLRIRHHCRT